MKKYSMPKVEVIELETEDIILTSEDELDPMPISSNNALSD